MSKKILFFLINMDLGGTEKSFLNLLEIIPDDVEIDVLLLEKKGVLLQDLPANVKILEIQNNEIINSYIHKGSRKSAVLAIQKRQYFFALKCFIQFLLNRLNIFKNPFWALEKYTIPQREKYDIAVSYAGIHDFISWYTLKKIKSEKKILWIHFDVSKVIVNTFFANKWYKKFHQIFCVSENATSSFKKMFPGLSNNTITFNNFVDKNKIIERSNEGIGFNDCFEGIRILTVGRLAYEKGQQMIPGIVNRLIKDQIKFRWYLVGDGSLFNELKEKIKEYGIEDYLVLLGSKLNPYSYLKNCDIYVQTSLHEGYCLTLEEALVLNKPIITTDFLSASNLISHNKNGLIVTISENEIYQSVKALILNEDIRKRLSENRIDNRDFTKLIRLLLN